MILISIWQSLALLTILSAIPAVAEPVECPEGEGLGEDGDCHPIVYDPEIELDFDALPVTADLTGPGIGLVMDAKRPDFRCDEFRKRGELDRWENCLASYYGLGDVLKVSGEIASSFAESGECPKDFHDISKLKTIAMEYARAPFDVDLTEIVVFPIDPFSSRIEPHLPVTCGYNSSQNRWYRTSLYSDGRYTYQQGKAGLPKSSDVLAPVAGESNLQQLVSSSPRVKPAKGWREGGNNGDLRLIPIGHGVFVETYSDSSETFFHGLLIVPQEREILRKACEKEAWLEANEELISKRNIQDTQAAVRLLIARGEALQQIRSLTKRAKSPGSDLAEMAHSQPLRDARKLARAFGRGKLKPETGESACALLSSRYPVQVPIEDQEATITNDESRSSEHAK